MKNWIEEFEKRYSPDLDPELWATFQILKIDLKSFIQTLLNETLEDVAKEVDKISTFDGSSKIMVDFAIDAAASIIRSYKGK